MPTRQKKSVRNRLLNILILLLFLSGIYLVARPYVFDYLNSRKADSTLELVENQEDIAEKRRRLAQEDLYGGADVTNITKEAYQNADAEKIIFTYGIGKIVFLEQDIAVPVVEGVTNDALLVGAGTLKANQEVGRGNFSLAAHRLATRHSILFSNLKNTEIGEHVRLTIGADVATYEITEKKVIDPTQVEYISDEQGDGLITLICCTDDSVDRWMVRGKLVDETPTTAAVDK
ncbi:class A sortase [Enterococcus timonensis]|uniref:class A sortase n=1 Tax=Enterococcus timonensis TaxID=1852364 RepID=UPI0008DA1C1D|nr:class A sortase [Enterococcus timonensis]